MRQTLPIATTILLLAVLPAIAADRAVAKPNVIFIVADDMGYADCGVHGCKDVPTPHIDSIATRGIRFTDGYVSGAVCSPTRAGLMTGRYHYRDGVHDWIPAGKPGLNAGVPIVAGYLKSAGYHTGHVGKWHLGEQPENHPMIRGFDEFYGFLGGGRDYFPDKPKPAGAKVNHYTQIVRGHDPVDVKDYITNEFGREAVEFLQRQKNATQPFFLYLCFNAVHTPMQATQEYLAKFSEIQDKNRRAYAGMLAAMDDNIGRVLNAVRDAGFEDNTLICFMSDNGGPTTRNAPNSSSNAPLRGSKGQTWEGGIRVPMFLQWTGRLKPAVYSKPVIQMDLTATVLALAGVTPEAKWPIDGVNLMPFLQQQDGQPHATLFWDYEHQWAIRKGPWKLVYAGPAKGDNEPIVALYDLTKDIGESNNLADQHHDLVNELKAEWQHWSDEVVINKPVPNPKL